MDIYRPGTGSEAEAALARHAAKTREEVDQFETFAERNLNVLFSDFKRDERTALAEISDIEDTIRKIENALPGLRRTRERLRVSPAEWKGANTTVSMAEQRLSDMQQALPQKRIALSARASEYDIALANMEADLQTRRDILHERLGAEHDDICRQHGVPVALELEGVPGYAGPAYSPPDEQNTRPFDYAWRAGADGEDGPEFVKTGPPSHRRERPGREPRSGRQIQRRESGRRRRKFVVWGLALVVLAVIVFAVIPKGGSSPATTGGSAAPGNSATISRLHQVAAMLAPQITSACQKKVGSDVSAKTAKNPNPSGSINPACDNSQILAIIADMESKSNANYSANGRVGIIPMPVAWYNSFASKVGSPAWNPSWATQGGASTSDGLAVGAKVVNNWIYCLQSFGQAVCTTSTAHPKPVPVCTSLPSNLTNQGRLVAETVQDMYNDCPSAAKAGQEYDQWGHA